jgi:hypothetical protein
MTRLLAVVGLTAIGFFALRADIDACGDKSLSAGGVRMQRALAARYPASILIYGQPSSRLTDATRELKLQTTLQQVGHKYREVSSSSELESALASGQFNVVIADVADLSELHAKLGSSKSRPVLVPIAYKLTKTESAAAARDNRFLIKAPGRSSQYLMTITEAVRSTQSSSRG